MHRMIVARRIDDPPSHRVADVVDESLRVWPGASIDDGQYPSAFQVGSRNRIRPHADDEDAIARWPTRRVDDNRSRELRIFTGAKVDVASCRRPPIVVRAWCFEPETEQTQLARC